MNITQTLITLLGIKNLNKKRIYRKMKRGGFSLVLIFIVWVSSLRKKKNKPKAHETIYNFHCWLFSSLLVFCRSSTPYPVFEKFWWSSVSCVQDLCCILSGTVCFLVFWEFYTFSRVDSSSVCSCPMSSTSQVTS